MTKIVPRPLLTRVAFAMLWLFVFSLPLAQATEIPAIGMISKVAGVLAMTAGAVAVVARRQIRILGAVHVTMAGLILWSGVTLCWSIAPDLTLERIMTYIQLYVLVLLVWEFCVDEKQVFQILNAFVLGTIIPALLTLAAFLPGQQILMQRAALPGYDSNILAFMLALSLPAAYYLILRDQSPASALYRLQMGFAVCAVLLTGSAATMVAMVVGLSLLCSTFYVIPVRTRLNVVALLMVLGAAALLFVPPGVARHFSEEIRKGGISFTSALNREVNTVRSTPIGGYGAGTMTASADRQPPVVRTAGVTMFSETGVMGATCFITLLSVLFLSAERLSGVSRSFWFTVIGVWIVGVCGLHWECSQPAWLLFGLLACHAACGRQDGATVDERKQHRNYYIEESAEIWS